MALVTDSYQIGASSDPNKNFTLRQPDVPDGSLILSRGNASAPGSTILTVNPQGAIVLPDGTYVGGNGRRNKLRNGNGRINQRGGTGGNTTGIWLADGWYADANVSTITTTVANNLANNPSKTGGVGLGLANGASVKATLAASDYLGLYQKIEGLDFADMQWGTANAKPLTISFQAYASQATVIPLAVRTAAGSRSYVTPITLAAGFGYYSYTIPGDQSGTWPTDNTASAMISFCGAAGSAYVAPAANTWSAGNFVSCPTCSNICDTANRYVVFSDIQAEAGPVATPYEWRDYGEELRRCQRYCYPFPAALIGRQSTTTQAYANAYLPVQMRDNPTIYFKSVTGTIYSSNSAAAITNMALNAASPRSLGIVVTNNAVGAVGYAADINYTDTPIALSEL